jgi:hypothetical protein
VSSTQCNRPAQSLISREVFPGKKHCESVHEYAISTARHRHRLHLATPLRDYPPEQQVSTPVMKRKAKAFHFADIPTHCILFRLSVCPVERNLYLSISNDQSSSHVARENSVFRPVTPVLSSFPLMLRTLSCSEYSRYSNYR